LATALKRSGELEAYCTTVYYRPKTLTSAVSKLLPQFWRKKAASRHCDDLDDEDVIQFSEFGGLIVLFCHNIPFANRWYWQIKRSVEDRFAKKVARLAASTEADAVICYDGCSATLFEELGRISPKTVRIIDMSAANALYLREVYERDEVLKPAYSESLHGWKRVWDPVDVERTMREISSADGFLCGSSFVERSLAFSGVEPERCEVCHYGVDTEAFPYRQRTAKSSKEPLSFVYLGMVSEHKGISYLFEAFRSIPKERAKLICIGKINIPDSITANLPSNIELKGMVLHDQVSDLLLSSDVMLFPSLGEGFSLSVIEGLASGLPIVCSDNTGAADCIVEGENGFVVPTQDAGALREKIEWFLENREKIPAMAERARRSVLGLTWDAYYKNVVEAVERLVSAVNHG
jgi:glycosyltransferase involved in cell wall biosynthesis